MKLQKILASVILMLTLITTAIPAIGATAGSSLPVEEAPLTDEHERAGWNADGNVVYASASVNVRTGPGTGYDVVGKLAKGDAVRRIAYSDKWSKIAYKGHVRYISNKYVTLAYPYSSDRFPLRYYDLTSTVTVYKEKYAETWCICAHIEYTRFDRFCGELALGAWCGPGGGETTETLIHFAYRKDAILAVNGDNNRTVGGIGKNSVLYKDDSTFCAAAAYNAHTGKLVSAEEGTPLFGGRLSLLMSAGLLTDSFSLATGSGCVLRDSTVIQNSSTFRTKRTIMGTNGQPGDIWLIVAEGRLSDGESPGLTLTECGRLLKSKGCTFGVVLDGGASSAMVFLGRLISSGGERAVHDFVIFK